jgi:hypothetical protein
MTTPFTVAVLLEHFLAQAKRKRRNHLSPGSNPLDSGGVKGKLTGRSRSRTLRSATCAPQIASMLRADVSGGEGGGPGRARGIGGNGGNATVQGGSGGAGGPNGPSGPSGTRGPAGRAGVSSITAGDVRAAFQNIEGVTLL